MKHCKNCDHLLQGKYCSFCGQQADVPRITFHSLINEVFHFFTHMQKGFLFTTVQLLQKPAETVKDFIAGKRKKYQSPVSYFLIWISIYILFLYGLEKLFGENIVINYKDYFGAGNSTQYAIRHLGLVLLMVVPFQALFLYLFVTAPLYNYWVSVACTFYSLGTIIVLQFCFAVLALLVHLFTGISVPLNVSDVFKVLYISWFIFHLVKRFPVNHRLLRISLFIVFAFGTFTFWRLIGYPAFAQWLFASGGAH
jgi:hypothetical protein